MEEKYLYTAKPTPRHGTTARINDMCQRLHRLAKVNTLIFYFPRKFHRSNIIFQNYDFVIEMPSFLNSCKIRRSQVSDRYAFLKASRKRLGRLVRAIFVMVGKEQKKGLLTRPYQLGHWIYLAWWCGKHYPNWNDDLNRLSSSWVSRIESFSVTLDEVKIVKA